MISRSFFFEKWHDYKCIQTLCWKTKISLKNNICDITKFSVSRNFSIWKNGCNNGFQVNNEKFCSWSRNRILRFSQNLSGKKRVSMTGLEPTRPELIFKLGLGLNHSANFAYMRGWLTLLEILLFIKIGLRKLNFFGAKEFFYIIFDFKNGCKNEFKDNNEKSCSWSGKELLTKLIQRLFERSFLNFVLKFWVNFK